MCNKLIKDAKEKASLIMQTCDYIMEGHNESQACKKFNMDKRKFRQFLRTNYSGCNTVTPLDEKSYIEHSLSPAEQLYCRIMNISDTGSASVIFPNDVDETMEFIMNKQLNTQEISLLKNRLWKQMTLQEIANEQKLSREYIRQKEIKIIKKLSTQENKDILVYGLEIYIQQQNIKDHQIELYRTKLENTISEEITELEKQLELCKQQNDIIKLKELKENIDVMIQMYNETTNMDINFMPKINKLLQDELISLRAKNCISFINDNMKPLKYVSDLMNFTESELLSCRNLGVGVLSEIKDIANKYNIHLKK